MTEAQLYEKIGRQQASLDALRLAYAELLLEFAHVLTGEVAPERVTIDLTNQTWTRAPLEDTNGEATP